MALVHSFHLIPNMTILCCFYFSAVLVVRVPSPFGVWGRVWNSIVSVPDHCLLYLLRRMKNHHRANIQFPDPLREIPS